MSGMMGRPLAEDLAVVNNTLSTWSLRSVRMTLYSRYRRAHHYHNRPYSPNMGSAYAPLILKSVFPHPSPSEQKRIANEPQPSFPPLPLACRSSTLHTTCQ
jgi:hypothetical protein